MPKDNEKSLRQLSLLSFLLGSGRPVSSLEVQQNVEGYGTMTDEAFKKRFYDDRQDLGRLSFQILKVSDPRWEDTEAYFLPKENYALPNLHLSAREVQALTAALLALQGGFPYEQPLRLAVNALRLAEGMPNTADQPLRISGIHVGNHFPRGVRAKLARLDDAVTRRKSVEFCYRPAAESQAAPRRVDPYGLFLISGHWYVAGRDHQRQAQRMFRVDRMSGRVTFLTKKPYDFEPPTDYDPADYAARPPWLLGQPVEEARVWIDRRFAWWVDRTYGRFVQRLDADAGGYTYAFPYATAEPLAGWALRHRSLVVLQQPEELRAAIRRGLETVIRLHGQETVR